jgi:hypothetical protein
VEEVYKTTDLYYSAYLKVAGVVFRGVERENGRVAFLFDDQGPLVMRDLRNAYFTDAAKVAPLLFVQAIKAMKSLTFNDQGERFVQPPRSSP